MNAVIQENSPRTTADMMARLFEIRSEKAALKDKEKSLSAEADLIEAELLKRMDEQGSTRVSTSLGTAIVTETVLPNVNDWDALYEWIKANDAFHILQRRVSSPAYRELLDTGTELPGTNPYRERSISLRSS